MKIDVGAESPSERLALTLGLVPTPVFHTLVPVLAARALLAGTKVGVFEALGQNPLTAADVAAKLGTEGEATGKLLNAMTGLGYLRAAGNGFVLSPGARRWLVSGSPRSLRDWVLEQELLEWRWLEHLEDFVRTGHAVQAHDALSDDAWGVYQRGMRSVAGLSAAEVARRVPVPKGAQRMLDIGGSHGYYSVVICRRHPGLRSVVLDLPQARPGGFFVILDFVRPRSPKDAGQAGTLNDLFFALTSASGTWPSEELAQWQRSAGLQPRKPVRMRTPPDTVMQAAVKPRW